jgi:glycosyltransferase involved in cell wall biosynthesis
MERRGLVTYSSGQDVASVRAADRHLRRLGFRLDFFHYSYFRGLPRRPNRLAGLALEEARILRAIGSGSYSFAIIPGHLVRYRLLSTFLRLGRKHGVDIHVYWHDCGWILAKVRDLAGDAGVERTIGLFETYQPKHLVVSPSTFAAIHREVRIPAAHCVWNAAPRPELQRSPIPDDLPPVVLNVASVQLRKAPELFLDIAQRVCARHETVKFVWVGGHSDAGLRSYINSAGLRERVAFVGWSDNTGSWFSRASALLLTSRSEAFGLVVAEAMAGARTVIAFAGTGAAEALGDTGVIVSRFDTVGAAESILELLQRPAGERINEPARLRHEKMFTPEAFAHRIASVLEGSSELLLTAPTNDSGQDHLPSSADASSWAHGEAER